MLVILQIYYTWALGFCLSRPSKPPAAFSHRTPQMGAGAQVAGISFALMAMHLGKLDQELRESSSETQGPTDTNTKAR